MNFRHLFSIASIFFFNTVALAQDAAVTTAAPEHSPLKSFLLQLPPILAMIAIFYFLIFLPQKKESRKQAEFLSSLKKGQTVVTAGGLLGTVVGISEKVVTLEISQGTEVKVLKNQVQSYLNESASSASR